MTAAATRGGSGCRTRIWRRCPCRFPAGTLRSRYRRGFRPDLNALPVLLRKTHEGYWSGKPCNIETLAKSMGNSPQVCREHYLN